MSSFLRSRSSNMWWYVAAFILFFYALKAKILFSRTDLDSGRFLCFKGDSRPSYKKWILNKTCSLIISSEDLFSSSQMVVSAAAWAAEENQKLPVAKTFSAPSLRHLAKEKMERKQTKKKEKKVVISGDRTKTLPSQPRPRERARWRSPVALIILGFTIKMAWCDFGIR